MIRLAWRQFRLQAAIAASLLALVAVVVILTGAHLAHLYDRTVAPCASRRDCSTAIASFLRSDQFLQAGLPPLLLVAPALMGVFWGAPLVAREIETGTFRLAWTQSVSRLRWLAVRLGLVGVVTMITAGLLSLMVTWWFSPIDRINLNRFSPGIFSERGITPIGYAAFAFALGVTIGVLIRRTVPAMALTIVGFVGTRLAVTYWIRPLLAAPLKLVTALTMPGTGSGAPPGSWVLSDQTLSASGRVIGENGGVGPNSAAGVVVSGSGAVSIPGVGSCPGVKLPTGQGPDLESPSVEHAFDACVRHHGLRELLTYQSASRFWPFQWYETAIFLALALILIGVCWWWLIGREQRMSRRSERVHTGVVFDESLAPAVGRLDNDPKQGAVAVGRRNALPAYGLARDHDPSWRRLRLDKPPVQRPS